MSLFYRIAYLVGFTPWDTGVSPPELVAAVEGERALAPGRALDLGCGTGTNVVYLCRHGWEATGVDEVRRALARARRRAARAGVSPRLVRGDVTRLPELGVGGDHTLLLDLGCYHGVPASRRDAYAGGVTAAAAPGATLLLYGFLPGALPRVPGVTADELRRRFPGWELTRATPGTGGPAATFFELRRR